MKMSFKDVSREKAGMKILDRKITLKGDQEHKLSLRSEKNELIFYYELPFPGGLQII